MKKLIVVMDLGCIKAYRVSRDELSGTEQVEQIEHYDAEAAHSRFSETVTDQSGRFPGGGKGGALSHGENHNALTETRKRLLHTMTDRLNSLLRRESHDFWYLGVAKEIHHRVIDLVDLGMRKNLRKELAADLTKINGQELLERFRAA